MSFWLAHALILSRDRWSFLISFFSESSRFSFCDGFCEVVSFSWMLSNSRIPSSHFLNSCGRRQHCVPSFRSEPVVWLSRDLFYLLL